MYRAVAVVLASAALLLCSSTAAMAQPTQKTYRVAWTCTLAGTLVAAGVGAAFAPITGGLAGGAFTAGCELGKSHNRKFIEELPQSPNTGYVWQRRPRTKHRPAYTRRVKVWFV